MPVRERIQDIPYHDNGTVRLFQSDARQIPSPDGSVHCVVTSPPYWGLRSYKGLEPLIWGGDADHGHGWEPQTYYVNGGGSTGVAGGAFSEPGEANAARIKEGRWRSDDLCPCGAWRGHLGLEPTVEQYVANIVEVFREVWRVLRDDGTLWLNLGDSYAGSWGNYAPSGIKGTQRQQTLEGERWDRPGYEDTERRPGTSLPQPGLKPKDLVGIPWLVAFALRADGWWLRSDIIWSKPNPMPESVTDRPTKAHEYLFLLLKSGTVKYWTHRELTGTRTRPAADYRYVHARRHEVVEEPDDWRTSIIVCPTCDGSRKVDRTETTDLFGESIVSFGERCEQCKDDNRMERKGVNPPPGHVWEWTRLNLWQGHDYFYDAEAIRDPAEYGYRATRGEWRGGGYVNQNGAQDNSTHTNGPNSVTGKNLGSGRNKRTVWTIPTQSFPDAHFATFPEKLVEPCILAGTSEHGVCADCGAPWERVVKVSAEYEKWAKTQRYYGEGGKGSAFREAKTNSATASTKNTTTGWRPTCAHDVDRVPATVLDPFIGSGTTALVAQKLGRRAVGIDLSTDYLDMAIERLSGVPIPMDLGGNATSAAINAEG